MSKVKITQVKSTIKRPDVQKRTMQALGLGKINKSVEKELNPAIEGMIRAVQHMIVVENI
ncbi:MULTISPECIES: 50S ribosomal protein L30 [Arcicella]|uniref:Large ribosomal subunit protein uL30 n=1 Tax=Arcicella aquatica TaxID=217141 RepID=A0ABU5QHG4_9BACT|nr:MULTISPECIES: 50S ribosomal protein L30 [Arcicella]MDR6560652.1 large subunit ribosomal protein L30 [Arcicella sp. BE51]MDR6810536.1 large subunit ribosomal protein L30 [Arcicella sp. BE140]MDR6821886.1 large subunit ribosomal protein L30 [Arcicella sp. BE139]MEA5256500.1 50S ribosomal protein L30 [Arcicella aquatica]